MTLPKSETRRLPITPLHRLPASLQIRKVPTKGTSIDQTSPWIASDEDHILMIETHQAKPNVINTDIVTFQISKYPAFY